MVTEYDTQIWHVSYVLYTLVTLWYFAKILFIQPIYSLFLSSLNVELIHDKFVTLFSTNLDKKIRS